MAETVQRTLPAEFIEALGKTYADQLTGVVGQPIDTSAFAPTVAAESALQQQARTQAGGLGTLLGPQAYQQFMSPYQQDVIDTTLSEFDRQAARQQQGIAQQAIQAGAFGGSREGVAQAEYQTQSDRNRAALQAQLLQQGYGMATQQAQQQLQAAQGLGAYQTQLGQAGQAQEQAILDASRQAAETAAYEPYQRLGFFGTGVTGLMGGYPGQYQFTQQPTPSPLQTALGVGSTLAGIYGAVNPRPLFGGK